MPGVTESAGLNSNISWPGIGTFDPGNMYRLPVFFIFAAVLRFASVKQEFYLHVRAR